MHDTSCCAFTIMWDTKISLRDGAFHFRIAARPGADSKIALLPFLQTKTKYTAFTMWPVWAREFGFWIVSL